jgi:SAM-dependent methyltransferase
MEGYSDASYGDGFADVYDDWYHGISDVATTTEMLESFAGTGRVLELGVGTGRLAVPLAARGCVVHGLDSSTKMVDRMLAKPGGDRVVVHIGDMVDDQPAGPFSLVFVAYNTFFNLLTEARQQRCFHEVAERLEDGGCFVIEAFVPDEHRDPAAAVTVRSVTADRVVLSVSTADASGQTAQGQYVDITEAGGVRLRPWAIRWATTDQLDAMAAAAGLALQQRFESFAGDPFGPDSPRHVSIFCKGSRANSAPVRPSAGDRS